MIIRGVHISQWVTQASMTKLVRRLWPGTNVSVQSWGNRGERRCRIYWSSGPSYDDMRALADEIEAAVPPKAAITIECRRVD
jgi:hypothetical protein